MAPGRMMGACRLLARRSPDPTAGTANLIPMIEPGPTAKGRVGLAVPPVPRGAIDIQFNAADIMEARHC